jgi:ABC-type uncharacterized transport system permease subunit
MEYLFAASLFMYFIGMVKYILYMSTRRQVLFLAATISISIGFAFHTAVLGLRSAQTGHGPYLVPFEYFTFFSWCVVLAFFIAEVKYKIRDLGAFIIPLAFLLLAYAWHLPWDKNMEPQTGRFWFTMHQTTALLGYSALAVTFAVGVMFIIQERALKSKHFGVMYFRMPPLETLDTVNRVAIDIGFPLITMGLISGLIWAHNNPSGINMSRAWPTILTWFIYGIIFVGRITVGWRGRKAARFGVVGFAIVIIGYIIHIY